VKGFSRTIRHHKGSALAALIVATALAVTGCSSSSGGGGGSTSAGGSGGSSSGSAAGASTQSITVLTYTIGSERWLGDVAQKEGIFAKNNLKVSFKALQGGVSATTALAGGSIDLAPLDPFNIAPLMAKGSKYTLVVGIQDNDWTMVGNKNLAGKPLKELMTPASLPEVGVSSLAGSGARYLQSVWQNFNSSPPKLIADPGGSVLLAGREPATMLDTSISCQFTAKGYPTLFSFLHPVGDVSSYPASTQALIKLSDGAYWSSSKWASSHQTALQSFQKSIIEAAAFVADPANLQKVTQDLRSGSDNVPTLTDQQWSDCVKLTIPSFDASFSSTAIATWNTLLKSSGVVPQGLPAPADFLAPGVPTGK
jgi:ABC-type nitrate/sulfonate/bicarbonate transport system substrate-binding protein